MLKLAFYWIERFWRRDEEDDAPFGNIPLKLGKVGCLIIKIMIHEPTKVSHESK